VQFGELRVGLLDRRDVLQLGGDRELGVRGLHAVFEHVVVD
jgi:hypothetical protein